MRGARDTDEVGGQYAQQREAEAVKIVLYVATDEPLTADAQALIDEAVREAGVADPELETRVVTSMDDAKAVRCLGSPTIRIEGLDVEYGEREPPETTNGERFYSTSEGWGRMPTVGMIVFAINEIRAGMGSG
ncbi:MAG: hypothetical protein OXC56_07525 [Chloroflexi bacterium]|nr:hypothetical protein [Chloroflexota bacterium]